MTDNISSVSLQSLRLFDLFYDSLPFKICGWCEQQRPHLSLFIEKDFSFLYCWIDMMDDQSVINFDLSYIISTSLKHQLGKLVARFTCPTWHFTWQSKNIVDPCFGWQKA